MTTREPGARLVLTVGPTVRPRATALRASRPGPDHDRRVAGVGAAGDGGDGHRAAADGGRTARRPRGRPVASGAVGHVATLAFEVGARPSSAAACRVPGPRRARPGRRPRSCRGRSAGAPGPAAVAARPGSARRRQVELERLVEVRARRRLAPEALLVGVGLDQRDLLGRPAGQAQVGEGLVVDREERGRGAELGRHVGDRRPVGQRQARQAVAGELDEGADDAVAAQQLGDDEHEVGGRRADAAAHRGGGRRRRSAWAGRAAGRGAPPRPRCPRRRSPARQGR